MKKISNYYRCPWTYPSNWIENMKNIFFGFKRCLQRGRYGICRYDIWDFDHYLMKVFENGISVYRKDNVGVPISLTEKQWDDILTRMEELIKIVQIDGVDCEAAEKYFGKDNERWYEEVKKWEKYRIECWEEFCDLMSAWFFDLWW